MFSKVGKYHTDVTFQIKSGVYKLLSFYLIETSMLDSLNTDSVVK
jgi:hypothetical protein